MKKETKRIMSLLTKGMVLVSKPGVKKMYIKGIVFWCCSGILYKGGSDATLYNITYDTTYRQTSQKWLANFYVLRIFSFKISDEFGAF